MGTQNFHTIVGAVSNVTHYLVSVDANNVGYINVANTVMLAICTALVLFMVPGLAFFYSGLLRKKNALSIIMQCFASAAIVTVIWITVGFAAAFGPSIHGIIGDVTKYSLFRNILFENNWDKPALIVNTSLAAGVPFILFWLFQLAFAIITPALVVGAFADRLKWRGYVLFNILFTIFIYIPVCHWLWGGGFLSQWGGIDWAGGIVIHVTCGFAAIGSVIVLRKRKILLKESTAPHSIPLVAIGAAILFFGWFGFNTGGSTFVAMGANPPPNITDPNSNFELDYASRISNTFLTVGINSFVSSFLAMSMGMLVWILFDFLFNRKVTLIGALTGGIAGLATITPAAGYVLIWGSLPIGALGGIVCYGFAKLNHFTHFDDALEVWPVHGMGGVTGAIVVSGLVTLSANPNFAVPGYINVHILEDLNAHINGYGSLYLFVAQLIAVALVSVWTFLVTLSSFVLIRFVINGRADELEQIEGLDQTLHGEQAYGSQWNVQNILNGNGDIPEFKNIDENYTKLLKRINKRMLDLEYKLRKEDEFEFSENEDDII